MNTLVALDDSRCNFKNSGGSIPSLVSKLVSKRCTFACIISTFENMSAEMNDIDSKQKFASLTVNQIIGIDIRLTTNVNKVENSK